MNRIFFVVFSLLFLNNALASSLNEQLQQVESEWAKVYYQLPKNQQKQAFEKLQQQSITLSKQFPRYAEPIILQAMITATLAGLKNPIAAIMSIHNVKKLLEQAIAINPNAADGAAFVALGSLYYKVPSWPIAFGDNKKAQQLLETALKINPNGIDSNYFYADFLINQNKQSAAIPYLKKALAIPSRNHQHLADSRLQAEAQQALENINPSYTATNHHTSMFSTHKKLTRLD